MNQRDHLMLFVYKHCPHLQDLLVEAGLLGEHLELPGVRVLVDLEVGLHDPQLVVLEGGPGPLGLGLGQAVTVQPRGIPLKKRGVSLLKRGFRDTTRNSS